ncbi:MAG: exopolysaccharide biosynthesis protein [Phenylobacterium sp.]|uniref:exopolysaccharide biosynthesis protein n=1 Tax=Phenylobacterium sp. TaxID=1871053 RepID=UPI00391CC9EA
MSDEQAIEMEHVKPLSQILRELTAADEGTLSVGQIISAFGPRALGALLFVFAAPNLLPLPPGSSTVLGAPLVLLAPQLALGVRRLWLPPNAGRRTIRASTLHQAFGRIIPWLERVEHVSRPRLGFLFGRFGDRFLGLMCVGLSLVLILPLPFGNLLPAAAITALSLSLVLRDGVLALLGYALAAASWSVLYVAGGAIMGFFRHMLTLLGTA